MKLSFRFILLIPLLILAHTVCAQSPDKQAVLERIIDAYGGENNLRKLYTVVQEWDFVALMGNRHGTDIRSIRVPGRLRVELTYPDKKETRILNGEAAHVIFNDYAAQTAAPMQRDAMRLQLMRLYSPLVLRDKSDSVTLVSEGEFCALSLTENGVQSDYLVNRESWRIEKVVGTLEIKGSEMQFLTEYSDFKFVDGALIHQKENKYAGGVNTAMLQLRRITFNAELDEESFAPQ
ncbi:MAG: hypothetical protein GWP58_10365 [Gammaproteobacteria bacterium]|jgi:hypothetical protein|nr:hypothetical protein [Gammaproteobacteria bacterium]